MTKPLFDVFREAMMGNATGSRKEQMDSFIAAMKADPAYLDLLAVDYFDRMAAQWTVRETAPASHTFVRTDAAQGRIERAIASRSERTAPPPSVAAIATAVDTMKSPALVRRSVEEAAARTTIAFNEMKAKLRSVVLLDLLLPNGKALRNATGAECAKAGGFFADVAKAIKPSQVVDRQLSEGDLQNILARHYQKNKKDAA
jgi:hypothetical protein